MQKDSTAIIQENGWMSSARTLVEAREACVSRALDGRNIPKLIHPSEARQTASEHLCLGILSTPSVKKILDARTYQAFEDKLKSFKRILSKDTREWLKSCSNKKGLELRSCLEEIWPKKVETIFDRWAQNKENRAFKTQKSLFLMRAANDSAKIKRRIASEAGDS